jgi:hypothetical protein
MFGDIMLRIIVFLLLLAPPVFAQTVTNIYVKEPNTGDSLVRESKRKDYADVVISFATKDVSYILMSLTRENAIEVWVNDFEWDENGEISINRYGIKSITTSIESYTRKIKISTYNVPKFKDYVFENNLIIRVFSESDPKVKISKKPNKEADTFPICISFLCEDMGRQVADTLEYRFLIKVPKKDSLISGYQSGSWTPWAQGDSGSVVFDSLPCPGKYSVKVQARNKNTGVESKKIETKFKYKK